MEPRQIKIIRTAIQSYAIFWQNLTPFGLAFLRYAFRLVAAVLVFAACKALTGTGPLLVAGIAAAFSLYALSSIAMHMDMYRYIVLGEQPSLNPAADLFGPRPRRVYWAVARVWMIGLVASLFPAGAAIAAWAIGRGGGSRAGAAVLMLLGVVLAVLALGYMSRYAFAAVCASLDMRVRLRDVAAFAKPIQWKILLTPILAVLPLAVLDAVVSGIGAASGRPALGAAATAASVILRMLFSLMTVIPIGLLFLKSKAIEEIPTDDRHDAAASSGSE